MIKVFSTLTILYFLSSFFNAESHPLSDNFADLVESKSPSVVNVFTVQKPQETKMGKDVVFARGGGLMEATAKLKAKGFSEGGAVTKDKTVAIDKSPNSGLITTKGFGASRRT